MNKKIDYQTLVKLYGGKTFNKLEELRVLPLEDEKEDIEQVIIIDLVGVPNSLLKTKEKNLINDIKKLNNQV